MDSSRLTRLMAEAAIRAQLHNYCRAMDRRDPELGYSVWHPDGTADYGAGVFQGTGRAFVDHVTRSHLRYTVHSHQIATIGIEVVDDRAASEAYATVRLCAATGDGFVEDLYVGRYLDLWSYRDGWWAIDHRRWVLDFAELGRPVRAGRPSESRRDRTDPSYALFHELRTPGQSPT